MNSYSIAELEQFSGVKANTIRIWERRYSLLDPHRTETNIRYYDDEHLRTIINTVSLMRHGHKISKISKYTDEDIARELEAIFENSIPTDDHFEVYVNTLLVAALEFNEINFDKSFSNAILRYGLHQTYIKIIYPLLGRVGMMWGKNEMNPAQEHFISNLCKQKLFSALDGLPAAPDSAPLWVLFLPQDEDHEIGLLFANYVLRSQGVRVVYLGQNVPQPSLEAAVEQLQAKNILFFIVQTKPNEVLQTYLDSIATKFADINIMVAGNSWVFDNVTLPEKIIKLDNIDALLERL